MSLAMGIGTAVAAGGSFAAAGVLQQRVAARTLTARPMSAGLLVALSRQPQWLAGIGLAAASFGLQALALSAAPLAVVQPLLVSELVFAIPVSARLQGRPLRAREWAAILTVAVGIAASEWGVAATRVGGGGSAGRWLVVGGGFVGAAVLLASVARRRGAMSRAILFASAAAFMEALSAALLAATVHGIQLHGLGGLARPAPYAMAVTAITELLLIQSSFQAGPLAVTMPMIDWVAPIVAVLLGVSVLGESVDTSPAHVSALGVGAVLAFVGILALDTSPRVRAMSMPAAVTTGSPEPLPENGAAMAHRSALSRPCRAARSPGVAGSTDAEPVHGAAPLLPRSGGDAARPRSACPEPTSTTTGRRRAS
ncbi:MAG: DMT family transporter [Acidimicrobiales bacterium]